MHLLPCNCSGDVLADLIPLCSNHRVHANDDILKFNTQRSSQWDGFRHFPYQDYPEKGKYIFYGGMSSEDARDKNVTRNGTQSEHPHPRDP